MNNNDLHDQIVESLDVEKKWQEYLEENEMDLLEKWKFCWKSAKDVYRKGGVTFTLLVMITMLMHGVMEAGTQLPLPAFLKNTYTFLYLAYSFVVLVPPFYGMWINRSLTHKDGTYGRSEFEEVLCVDKAIERITFLLDLAILNSVTVTRHRRNIRDRLSDITLLKYATQRGGRSTVELQKRIKEVLEIINKRLTILKDTLEEGYEVRSMIQYCVKHPSCVRAKERVAIYFTDAIHLTLLGYRKLDEVVEKIHAAYAKHEDPSPALLAELDNLDRMFQFHNYRLLGGNLRKSA